MNRGEKVTAELPDCINDLDGYRYLQGKITAASDEKAFRTLYDNLAPEVWGAPTKHAAAQLISVSGPGAMDWHAQCPYASHLVIPSTLLSTLIRLELFLPHPRMLQPDRFVTACAPGARHHSRQGGAWTPRGLL